MSETRTVLIEDAAAGEWVVSYDGPNPRAEHCRAFDARAEAQAHKDAADALRCARCGSDRLLSPAFRFPEFWTCDPCGHDTRLPVGGRAG